MRLQLSAQIHGGASVLPQVVSEEMGLQQRWRQAPQDLTPRQPCWIVAHLSLCPCLPSCCPRRLQSLGCSSSFALPYKV